MAFTKTVGGVDPWSMPSDGTDLIRISRYEKAWERRQYHRGRRRESQRLIMAEFDQDALSDHGKPDPTRTNRHAHE